MNGIWSYFSHKENDQSRLFRNIPWQAAKKGQWKLSGKQKNSIQIPFTHEFVYFFQLFIFLFPFLRNFSLSKKLNWKHVLKQPNFKYSSWDAYQEFPRQWSPQQQQGDPRGPGGHLQLLDETSTQQKIFACKSTSPLPASPSVPALRKTAAARPPPPQDRRRCRQVLSCSCKTPGSPPPTSPASPPPIRRARW